MRHCLLIALSGALVLSCFSALADAPGGTDTQEPQVTIRSGVFIGHWQDGTTLTQTITMVTPDMITLRRHAYSSRPVIFRRIDPRIFRDRYGNTLTMVSAQRVIWRDLTARHVVIYLRSD